MSVRIQLRRDSAANWASVNPILAAGEVGIVTDDLSYKVGNGITAWNSLPAAQLTGVFGAGMTLTGMADPSPPAAGQMRLYSQSVGGRLMAKIMGPSGLDTPLQPAIFANNILSAFPGNAAVIDFLGANAAPTAVGTVSHPTIASGVSLRQATRRSLVTSAATANSASELRFAFPACYRGEVFGAAVAGGFHSITRWGMSSATALQRAAVGLWSSSGVTAVTQVPSALTNCLIAGWDSGDTQVQIMCNDAAGTCTKVALGTDFPANTPDAIYESTFFCAPNGDQVSWRVRRLDTGAVAQGVITTDMPSKDTMLSWHGYANNGGTAAAVVLDFYRMYLETDY